MLYKKLLSGNYLEGKQIYDESTSDENIATCTNMIV